MEKNCQDSSETISFPAKEEDKKIVEDPPKATLENSDSNEATTTCLDQIEAEDQEEKPEDFNGPKSRSESVCSDGSRTDTENEDDASVVLEREEGDGQESAPNRKVDDDEDKRNPQYIPKKGTFYEHDDRTAADEGEAEVKEIPEDEMADKDAAGKKKVWSEKEANKWSHDRFNDNEQAPKSRQELIAIYGYDIRNEEGPPRARRRRRYGRGPNKYTRNWEDEEAYSKPTNVSAKPVQRKPRTRPGQEEFPPLNPQDQRSESKSSEQSGDGDGDESNRELNKQNAGLQDEKENRDVRENGGGQTNKNDEKGNRDRNDKKNSENDEYQQRDSRNNQQSSRKDYRGGRSPQKRHEDQMRASVANNVRGVTKSRGFFKNGGRGMDSTRVRNQRNQRPNSGDEYSDYILSQNFTNKSVSHQQNVQKLEKDMANMTMQQTNQQQSGSDAPTTTASSFTGSTINRGGKFGNSGGNRQTSVPPRLQQEQRGSKRYSSLRQRSLPETAVTNFGPQPTYFQADYSQQPTSQTQPGLLPHPQPSIHPQVTSTTTPQLITVAPSQSLNPISHQGGPPANGAPLMQQAPPQFAPQTYAQPPPAFLQPAVAPGVAPFLPQQPPPPQIINYAQPQFTGQFGQFPHQQFNPVNSAPQPAELYQPQGGITYYSTQNQQLLPRVPQKRIKSAIPIVPPPEHKEPRGRGRLNQGEQESPGGSAPETPADNYDQATYDFEGEVSVIQQ